ncbi:uncharacterized protein LOC136095556 [Hydra vulgaris]|uniref:uncharacterized protein LOC136095556 n=1 Tax=Hydra vulgaris TaxID=6087 RepID=UPI0032EA390F
MKYKNICKTVKIESRKARCYYENDFVEKSKVNPKLLYKYVNSQKTIKQVIKALRYQTGCVTNDQNEIVEILNKQFQDVFTIENSTEELPQIKNLGDIIIDAVNIESFVKSELPTQWRAANITPLFKKGDKLEAANYRPVSLTSITCKIMEDIVRDCIQSYLMKYKLISKSQHDDTKILLKVNEINVENSLQKDLDSAEEWSKKWLLGFNSSKCVIMHYGTNNPRLKYTLNGVELKDSECEKDLGVYFSTNLKRKKQIISSTYKANSMMVPVWSPYFKGDISLLEKVQHRMTRLVPSLRKINYEKRLKILDISTLKTRRERGVLIQVFKLLNRFEEIDLINEPKLKIDSITRGHNLKYEREIVNYLPRHYFLINRTANLWNALPETVVTSKTVNQFKNRLDEYNAKSKKF